MNDDTKKLMFSHISDEYETPKSLFDKLDSIFHFTLDPCATHENHLCPIFFTKEENGLEQSWKGHIPFVNYPYSDKRWLAKCQSEYLNDIDNMNMVVLAPARIETKAFQENTFYAKYIIALKGRLKFNNRKMPSWKEDGSHKISSAPFPSVLIIYLKKGYTLKPRDAITLQSLGILYNRVPKLLTLSSTNL